MQTAVFFIPSLLTWARSWPIIIWNSELNGALRFVRGKRVEMFADAAMMALVITLFALCFGLMELCDRI